MNTPTPRTLEELEANVETSLKEKHLEWLNPLVNEWLMIAHLLGSIEILREKIGQIPKIPE